MNHSQSTLLDRLSPMPMVCPLIKLGRSSPPTAEQDYDMALNSQSHQHTSSNLSDDYTLLECNHDPDQAYHVRDNSYHPGYPHQKHMYHISMYSEFKNKPASDKMCGKDSGYGKASQKDGYQHKANLNYIPDYHSCKNMGPYSSNDSQGAYHSQRKIDSLSHQQMSSQSQDQYQYSLMCEQSSNYSNSSLICEQGCNQKFGFYENAAIDNQKMKSCNAMYREQDYKNKNILDLSSLSINDDYWNSVQNKSNDICANESVMCQHSSISQKYYSNNAKPLKRVTSPTINSSNYLIGNYSKLGKSSPNLDQGYHTLVSPSPGPSTPNPWTDGNISANMFKGKKAHSKNNSFDKLTDDIILKIFSYLYSYELSVCARVCRRFESLAWRPTLWKSITLCGEHISGDKAIRGVLRQLCGQGRTGACHNIERVYLNEGVKIADRGLMLLARRCPELTHLQIHGCTVVTNSSLHELVTRCTNLQHLDVTGCTNISCITVMPGPEPPRRLLLQYLDLTDCPGIEDNGLRIIVCSCPQLVYLYLRRCIQITDAGLKYVPSFCSGLRELSVSDCSKVTDFGLYELAKLGATLRYLSVAKCDQVSDAGLKVIARRCYKLRYLNARGCEAVSDDAITVLARSCTRLRALDIGKCDVSDAGLRALAESCPNIKKLSLRNCDLVTDRGIQCIAYYCRGLQQLNIQDCQISLEGYRAVKQHCKRCVIEHTNPGFF